MDLVRARNLVAQGRYVTALREASAAADQAAGAERVELFILAARSAQELGLHQESARLAGQALSSEHMDDMLRARALSAMGGILAQLGDYAQAEQYLIEAAAVAPVPDGRRHFNLGAVYEAMRRPDVAIAQYRTATQLFRAAGSTHHELKARQNTAWLLLSQRELGPARTELSITADLVEPNSPYQAQQLALEALAARVAGQTGEAVRICEDLLAPGYPGATAWCRCYAAWLVADVAADEDRPDPARQFLARARCEAEAAQDPALWNQLAALQNRLDDM